MSWEERIQRLRGRTRLLKRECKEQVTSVIDSAAEQLSRLEATIMPSAGHHAKAPHHTPHPAHHPHLPILAAAGGGHLTPVPHQALLPPPPASLPLPEAYINEILAEAEASVTAAELAEAEDDVPHDGSAPDVGAAPPPDTHQSGTLVAVVPSEVAVSEEGEHSQLISPTLTPAPPSSLDGPGPHEAFISAPPPPPLDDHSVPHDEHLAPNPNLISPTLPPAPPTTPTDHTAPHQNFTMPPAAQIHGQNPDEDDVSDTTYIIGALNRVWQFFS